MPSRAVRKYGFVFKIALSERLVYRTDFFVATFLRFLPIVTTILLWRAIYEGAGRDEVGGLSYANMVGYYLLVMVVRAFGSMPGLSSGIARDVREGDLRKFLLQPIDYLTYLLALRAAHKLVYYVMAVGPYAIVFWFCREYLPVLPDPRSYGLILATLVGTFLLGFVINCLLGLLAFWFLEVGSFLYLFMTVQYFLSGHMFPLSLLPDGIRRVVTLLPFAYETYYPTLVLLGRMPAGQTAHVVLVQAVWIVVLGWVARFAWARGLRRYAAFGG
jgi:ABC-2 type transport system permease protein